MTAQTGRTHVRHITVKIATVDRTAYVDNVGTIGVEYDTQDVTAYSDGARNVVIGQPRAPLAIGGPFDTTMHAAMIALDGVETPIAIDIQIGIRQAWVQGEPHFGMAASDTSGYLMHDYKVDINANRWTGRLDVFGPTIPAWSVGAAF